MVAHASQAPLVWIVVLTWNNYADTAECLTSLRTLSYPHYEVLLVDNASSDETPRRVRRRFPEVTVIENQRNLGVSAGYNVGFRYALAHGADFVLMLNNDTVLDPVLLSYLVAAGYEPHAGILVPVAYFYDRPDTIWSAGARRRQLPPAIVMEKRLFRQQSGYHQLEYAIGCCILLKRAALLQAGLLDETYYFMWEDLDLSLRMRAAGFLILQVPQAKLRHKVSRSTRPQTSLFWQMHGEGGVTFHRRYGSYQSMLTELGYFALREFVVKQQWQFLRPFVTGLRRGLMRPLKPIPQAELLPLTY